MRNRFLLFCLILSGFSGLSYELLWVRLLTHVFGSTSQSFSTVIAVFFLGLAIGSWLAARFLPRITQPVTQYAWIELGTGICALCLYPILVNFADLFAQIDPGPHWSGLLLRFICASILLIAPTILMGMSLPVACKAIISKNEKTGEGVGLVYGVNTLGACLGAFVVTYYLLPYWGVWGSVLMTLVVNFSAAILALWGRKGEFGWKTGLLTSSQIPSDVAKTKVNPGVHSHPLMLVAFILTFLSGFTFISFEVIWTRIFAVLLNGTVYGVGSVLISVLFGIAFGSYLASLIARFRVNTFLAYGVTQVMTAGLISLLVVRADLVGYLFASIHEYFMVQDSFADPRFGQLLLAVLILVVPSSLAGASLPILIQLLRTKASHAGAVLGRLYACNTLGSILGSVVTGFFLMPLLGSNSVIYLDLVLMALGVVFLWLIVDQIKDKLQLSMLLIASLAVVYFYQGYDPKNLLASRRTNGKSYIAIDKAAQQLNKELIYFREGLTSNVAVRSVQKDGLRSLTLNGLGQGSRRQLPPRYPLESVLVGLVPLSHIKTPSKALVVGLGAGITVQTLLEYDVSHIKVVELEREVIEAERLIFNNVPNPIDDPRVELVINDARHQLLIEKHQSSDKKYDLITSMPAHPWVASNIFTQEFFELARDNLTDRGVFSAWFGFGSMSQEIVQSLLAAFGQAFPHALVYYVPSAGALYLVGSKSVLKLDQDLIRERFSAPIIKDNFEYLTADFLPARLIGVLTHGEGLKSKNMVNTDNLPYVELWSPLYLGRNIPLDVAALFSTNYWNPEAMVQKSRFQTYRRQLIEELLGTPYENFLDQSRFRNLLLNASYKSFSTNDVHLDEYIKARRLYAQAKLSEARDVFKSLNALPDWKKRSQDYLDLIDWRLSGQWPQHSVSFDVGLELLSYANQDIPDLSLMYEKQQNQAYQKIQDIILCIHNSGSCPQLNELDVLQNIIPHILKTPHWGLVRTIYDWAQKNNWQQVISRTASLYLKLRQEKSMKLVNQANQIMLTNPDVKKINEAIHLYKEALFFNPTDPNVWQQLLRAQVFARADRLELESTIQSLRQLGFADSYIKAKISLIKKDFEESQKEAKS